MTNRSYEEDVEYWCGDPDAEFDPMLPHLTALEISGLGDSYDDGRIDTLTAAYNQLRRRLREMGSTTPPALPPIQVQ